ncbi:MAG: polysaccharide biosynthesis C-terminal domain-containing protein [Acidobacteriota bacterium]
MALNQSDLYFLEILGADDEVGHYAAASTSAHFLLIIQATVLGLIAPRLRPALDEGAAAGKAVYREGLRLVLMAVVPAAVVVTAAANPILSLFGPTFVDAQGELLWLVAGNAAWATAALAALWLQYTGRAPLVLGVTIATLVLDSCLNLVLIPRLGMHGAAVSTAATLAAAAATLVVLRRRALRAA